MQNVAVPHFNDNGQQVGMAARKALQTMMPEGQQLLPHYRQFSAVWNTISRQYSYRWDEAVKFGRENAIAMWRDGYLQALRQERLYPTAQLNWHIEPEDDEDPQQKALVKDFTKVVRRTPRFSDFRLSLLNAIWYGRYANQQTHKLTDVGGNPRYIVSDHSPVNGDKIQWTYDKVPCVMVNAQWKHPAATIIIGDRSPMLALNTPVWRDKFCIHKHECDDADYFEGEMSGAVHGVGLRTRLHWIYWMRDEMLAWVVSFMEKVGTMGVIVITYEENNAKSKADAETAAKQYAQSNVLVIPRPAGETKETTGVQLFPANVQGVNFLTTFIQEYFERHIERLFVGQSMSGGEDKSTGFGSSGRAELAANTKYQLLKFDAGRLDETLTTDFLGPLARLNYPLCKWHLRFVSDIPDPEAKDKLDAAKTFVEMGGTVVEDEIRKPLGFSRPNETDKVLGGQQGGAPGPMGGPTTNDGGMEPPKGPPGAGPDEGGGEEGQDAGEDVSLDGINLDVPPSQDLGQIGYLTPNRLRLNYESGGQWITIGGKVGQDGKKHGGSPVMIKDGRIVKGHPSLTGKKIGALKEEAEKVSARKEAHQARDYELAKLYKEARKEGIASKHVKTLADELQAHDKEYVTDHNNMLKDARKKLDQYGGAHRMLQAKAKRGGKGEIEEGDSIKGFDAVAQSMALEYPGSFGNNFGSKYGEYVDSMGQQDDPGQILFDYLYEGNREPMTKEEATKEAIKQIRHAIENGAKLQDEPGEAAEAEGDSDFDFGANVEKREPEAKPDRHWYGMNYRPAGIGTAPRDIAEHGKHDSFRHGTVGYDRPLSDQEVSDFELTPIRQDKDIPEVAGKIGSLLGEYGPEYLKPGNEDILADRLKRSDARKILGHVDHAKVVDELRKQVKPAGPEVGAIGSKVDVPGSHTTGPFKGEFVDAGNGQIGLQQEGSEYGPMIKFSDKKQAARFLDDLNGVVKGPTNSGNASIDRVTAGNAKFLGRGNDGLAFDTGDGNVVKASSELPFHWNNGLRSVEAGADRIRNQVKNNDALIKAGVPGILPQKLIEHGGRAYVVMPKLNLEDPLTAEHLEQVKNTIKAAHEAGYTIGDDIQAGIGQDGKAYVFDTGAARPLSQQDRHRSDDIEDDESRLGRLYEKSGIEFRGITPHRSYDRFLDTVKGHMEKKKGKPSGFYEPWAKELDRLWNNIPDDEKALEHDEHADIMKQLRENGPRKKEPHEASHEKDITSIPRGEVGYIGGHPVHHKPDGTFHLETDKYHVHGPEDIADRIRRNWKDQLPDQKRINQAYERANNWTEPNVFTDPKGSEAVDKARQSIPNGTRGVSLDPNTRGRIGYVMRGVDGVHLRLDHTPDAQVTDFEPLDEKHSWRVDRPREENKPKAEAPAMFSAWTWDDIQALKVAVYDAAGVEYKYCSTQFNLPDDIAANIIKAGRLIPDEDLADKGREDEPHVTVKYGIITADANRVRKVVAGFGPLNCKLGQVSVFEAKGNHDFDVVKLEIISDDLHRLNALISESFRCKDTHPTYQPHATIAYVKAGLGKIFAGNHPRVGEAFTVESIEFSNQDGEKTTISLVADYGDSPIFYQLDGEDNAQHLAQYYADLWNSIDEAGGTIPEEEYEQVGAELADGGWSIYFDHDSGRWKIIKTNYSNLFGIELYEVLHAPKGGVSVAGRHYVGGQFIPSADQANWSPEDKEKFKQAAEGSRSRYQQVTKARLQGRGEKNANDISLRTADKVAQSKYNPFENRSMMASLNALIRHHDQHVYQRLDELAEHLEKALDKIPKDEQGQRQSVINQLASLHHMAQAAHKMGIKPDRGQVSPPQEKPAQPEAKNAPQPAQAPTVAPQTPTESEGPPASLEWNQTPAFKRTGNADYDEWQKSFIPAYAQGLPILKGTPKQLRWGNELRDKRIDFHMEGAAKYKDNPIWREMIGDLSKIKDASFFINTRPENGWDLRDPQTKQRFRGAVEAQLEKEKYDQQHPPYAGGNADPLSRNFPDLVLGTSTNTYGPRDYYVKATPGDPLGQLLADMGEQFDTKAGAWSVRQEDAEKLVDAIGQARNLSPDQLQAAHGELAEDKADWEGKGRYKGPFGENLKPKDMPAAARETKGGQAETPVDPAETTTPLTETTQPEGKQTLQEALADQMGEKAPEAPASTPTPEAENKPKYFEPTVPDNFDDYLREKLGDQYGKPSPALQAQRAAEAAKKAEQSKPSGPGGYVVKRGTGHYVVDRFGNEISGPYATEAEADKANVNPESKRSLRRETAEAEYQKRRAEQAEPSTPAPAPTQPSAPPAQQPTHAVEERANPFDPSKKIYDVVRDGKRLRGFGSREEAEADATERNQSQPVKPAAPKPATPSDTAQPSATQRNVAQPSAPPEVKPQHNPIVSEPAQPTAKTPEDAFNEVAQSFIDKNRSGTVTPADQTALHKAARAAGIHPSELYGRLVKMKQEAGKAVEAPANPPEESTPAPNNPNVRIGKSGAVWVRAKAGGEVSPVTGQHFGGGQWMPIHGLTPKQEKGQDLGGEGSKQPPKPNENAAPKSPPQPRAPMTPEQIEAEKERRDNQRKWDEVRSGPLGQMKSMGERPHNFQSSIVNAKQWKEFAEQAGEERMKQIADKLQPLIDQENARQMEKYPDLPKDNHDWHNQRVERAADEDAGIFPGSKGHLKNVPSSLRVRQMIQHIIDENPGVDALHAIHQALAQPTQEQAAQNFQKGVKTTPAEANEAPKDIDKEAQEKAAEGFNKGLSKEASTLHPHPSEATTEDLKERLKDAWTEYHRQRECGATNHADSATRHILALHAELQKRGESIPQVDRKAQMEAIAAREASKKRPSEPKDLDGDQAEQSEPENPNETPREKAARQMDENYAFARQSAIPNVGEDLEASARHRANAWRGLEDAESHGTAGKMVTREKLIKNEPPVYGAVKPDNAISALLAHNAMKLFPPSWDNPYTQAERARDERYKQNNQPIPGGRTVTGEERSKQLRAQYLDAYRSMKQAAEAAAQRPGTDVADIVGDMKKSVLEKINELRGGSGVGPHAQGQMKDPYNPIANSLAKLYDGMSTWGGTPLMKKMKEFLSLARQKYGPDAAQNKEAIAQHVQDILDGQSPADSFGVDKGPGKEKFNPADMYISKHAERVGGRMIDTKTVKDSSNFLTNSTGMRGLQFGNYVSDDERQHHLKHAAEAFADLTDILGLPDELGSWDGKLGLAFGARGHGTAQAHYEPTQKVINLTRTGGVGTLAHEWGHFMDNMLAGGTEGTWASESPHATSDLGKAINSWHKAVHESGFKQRLGSVIYKLKKAGAFGDKKAEYWGSTIEVFARSFERYVQHKLKEAGRKNTYLSGLAEYTHDDPNDATGKGLWPTDQEVAKMAPAFDAIINHVKANYGKGKSGGQSATPAQPAAPAHPAHSLQGSRMAMLDYSKQLIRLRGQPHEQAKVARKLAEAGERFKNAGGNLSEEMEYIREEANRWAAERWK